MRVGYEEKQKKASLPGAVCQNRNSFVSRITRRKERTWREGGEEDADSMARVEETYAARVANKTVRE